MKHSFSWELVILYYNLQLLAWLVAPPEIRIRKVWTTILRFGPSANEIIVTIAGTRCYATVIETGKHAPNANQRVYTLRKLIIHHLYNYFFII